MSGSSRCWGSLGTEAIRTKFAQARSSVGISMLMQLLDTDTSTYSGLIGRLDGEHAGQCTREPSGPHTGATCVGPRSCGGRR